MSSTKRSEALFRHDDLPLPVEIRGIRGAKRLRLRLDEKRGLLKLTGPLRMSRKAALDWAAQQREWVEVQVGAMEPGEPFVPGARIPFEGGDVELVWDRHAPRTPRLDEERLVCGGPSEGFARRIELFLKRRALEALSGDTAEIAGRAGVSVRSVSVGDADTRWGSCSSTGRIRYSWRLILAPPAVRRYVVAHEVAHMRHMDHGPRFKALERELFGGDCDAARLLLRRLGRRLKRVGRGR
ncbi:MAG TPA: SprT family zinc-dependent metalloprotease [Sphingomicrobium sp.]|nr:SprT family zinc-dependent metalloprotease [Sphingomicrobium sp.]